MLQQERTPEDRKVHTRAATKSGWLRYHEKWRSASPEQVAEYEDQRRRWYEARGRSLKLDRCARTDTPSRTVNGMRGTFGVWWLRIDYNLPFWGAMHRAQINLTTFAQLMGVSLLQASRWLRDKDCPSLMEQATMEALFRLIGVEFDSVQAWPPWKDTDAMYHSSVPVQTLVERGVYVPTSRYRSCEPPS